MNTISGLQNSVSFMLTPVHVIIITLLSVHLVHKLTSIYLETPLGEGTQYAQLKVLYIKVHMPPCTPNNNEILDMLLVIKIINYVCICCECLILCIIHRNDKFT